MLGALFRPLLLGRLFGIPLRAVPAALLLFAAPVLIAAGRGGGALAPVALLVAHLVLGLLVHELGHALVARSLGLRVVDIVIWPLVGMARIEGLHERPGLEAPVAAAGPAANLALAGLFALLPHGWWSAGVVLNLVFGLGNLLPFYPLDGGRIVRAWLARRSPLVDATRAAIPPFWLLAVALVALGWSLDSWLVPLLLGLYLSSSAGGEYLRMVLAFGPPQFGRSEVWRRSFGGGSYAGATATASRTESGSAVAQNSPAREAEPRPSDLESFHGPLDEYFRDRR
jgi:Zn-dependent protease